MPAPRNASVIGWYWRSNQDSEKHWRIFLSRYTITMHYKSYTTSREIFSSFSIKIIQQLYIIVLPEARSSWSRNILIPLLSVYCRRLNRTSAPDGTRPSQAEGQHRQCAIRPWPMVWRLYGMPLKSIINYYKVSFITNYIETPSWPIICRLIVMMNIERVTALRGLKSTTQSCVIPLSSKWNI